MEAHVCNFSTWEDGGKEFKAILSYITSSRPA